MGTFRLRPNDVMLLSSEMSRIGHYEAAIQVKIADLDPDYAFQNVFDRLRVGDQVTVVSFASAGSDRYGRVQEIGDFRVISKTQPGDLAKGKPPRLYVRQVGKTITFPDPDVVVAEKPELTEMVRVKVLNNNWEVHDKDGNVLEQLGSEKAAVEWIKKNGGFEAMKAA